MEIESDREGDAQQDRGEYQTRDKLGLNFLRLGELHALVRISTLP
jgi:hypothetical protein